MADSSKIPPREPSAAMSEPTSRHRASPRLSPPPQDTVSTTQLSMAPMDANASEGNSVPATDGDWIDRVFDTLPTPGPHPPESLTFTTGGIDPPGPIVDDSVFFHVPTGMDWAPTSNAGHLESSSRFGDGVFFSRTLPEQQDHPGENMPAGMQSQSWPRARSSSRDDGDMDVVFDEYFDSQDEPQQLTFACPFYKLDPFRYRFCLFRHTSPRTNYFKQHLRRYHLQPIHCSICGELFRHMSDKDDHIRNHSCHSRAFIHDGITQYQLEMINRIPRTWHPKERWYQLWDILFPGKPRPATPYVKDPWDEVLEVQQTLLMGNRAGPFLATPGSNLTTPEMHKAAADRSSQGNPARWMSGPPVSRQTDTRDAEEPLLHSRETETSAAARLDMEDTVTHGAGLRGEGNVPEVADGTLKGASGAPWNEDGTIINPPVPRGNAPASGLEAADGAPKGASGGLWNEDDRTTDPPAPGSSTHTSGEPAVQGLTTPWVPGRADSIGRIDYPREACGFSLPSVDSIFSEQGGTSGKDSGYTSLESTRKAAETGDDAGSSYSVESILPALGDGYITTFSNRLSQDIDKLSSLSIIPGERLKEWVRLFGLKLHGESSTRVQREASVFIRKKRRYGTTPIYSPLCPHLSN